MATNALAPQNENALAALGLFPHINKYRKFNDPISSANMPIQALLGSAAATGGFLSDLLSNFQSPTGNELTGDVNYEQNIKLPYGTQELSKMLPLQPTTPNERFARGLGEMIPINPAPALRAVGKVGEMALRGAGEMANARMLSGESMVPGLSSVLAPSVMKFAKEPGSIRATAPVSELGFYSAVEKQALNIPRNQGSGESFLNDLLKGQDVKKYEIEAMGLADYLKGKTNVTRQEVQDYIAGNRVDVQERQLGGILSPEMQTTRDALHDNYRGLVDNIADAKSQFEEGKISYAQLRNTVSNNQIQIQALDTQINEINKTIPSTKYSGYQLPGGENYREILLTLPQKNELLTDVEKTRLAYLEHRKTSGAFDVMKSPLKDELQILQNKVKPPALFQSGHFKEPNILAHMRVNDRVDADGKKMLLIEEVQSDWHQAGRKKGYGPTMEKSVEAYYETKDGQRIPIGYGKTKEEAVANFDVGWKNQVDIKYETSERKISEGVSDAPFKETWHELALKRAIKEAVDKGYDRVGITTGKQQIDRFSNQLRQNVSHIEFQTGQKLTSSEAAELQALRQQQTPMTGSQRARYESLSSNEGEYVGQNETKINGFNGSRRTFTGTVKNGKFLDGPAVDKTVEEVLGKSMAKRIAEQQTGTLKGDDISIGGEGMKKYYDEIYPGFLNKLGKKYGSQVGETKVDTVKERAENSMIPSSKQETIRYLNITPEMRKAVKEGQPLASNKLLQYLV